MTFQFFYLRVLVLTTILLTMTACTTSEGFSRAVLGSSVDLTNDKTTPWSKNLKEGRYNVVITEINHLIDVQPQHPRLYVAYNDRGEAYQGKGELDNAIYDYDTALQINPRFAKAYNNRGNAYQQKHEFNKAIADYSKAIEFDPKFTQVYCNRASSYYSQKEYDKAWDDIYSSNGLCEKNSKFIDELRQASGRDK